MGTPDGRYYRVDYPFLGIIAAVTCGTTEEKEKFWETGRDKTGDDVRRFCRERYGLTAAQAELFVESVPQQRDTYEPDEPYTRKVIAELARELSGPPQKGSGQLAELDPENSKPYPTIAALYKGTIPKQGWEEDAVREVLAHPAPPIW